METWGKRSKETAYLLNPAFCGEIIYQAIEGYQEKYSVMPFTLIFFILPILLYEKTFDSFSLKIKHLSSWVQNKPEMLDGFESRIKSLKELTKETLLFLLSQDLIKFENDGFAVKTLNKKRVSKSEKYLSAYFTKAKKFGLFLAKAGHPENVYMIMGVTP